jgi:hypothetical protein
MQPRNLVVAAGADELAAADVLGAAAELDGAAAEVAAGGGLLTLDVLLPQAATSKVATPAAATVSASEVCLTVSSPGCGTRE